MCVHAGGCVSGERELVHHCYEGWNCGSLKPFSPTVWRNAAPCLQTQQYANQPRQLLWEHPWPNETVLSPICRVVFKIVFVFFFFTRKSCCINCDVDIFYMSTSSETWNELQRKWARERQPLWFSLFLNWTYSILYTDFMSVAMYRDSVTMTTLFVCLFVWFCFLAFEKWRDSTRLQPENCQT